MLSGLHRVGSITPFGDKGSVHRRLDDFSEIVLLPSHGIGQTEGGETIHDKEPTRTRGVLERNDARLRR
jgi:hypothetical protein